MEGASPTNLDGIEAARTPGYSIRPSSSSSSSSSRAMQLPGYILRIVAIVLTFISAIVMGVAKEAVTVIVSNDSGETTFTGSIKSTYSSALVYFIVVNVIVLIYSIISLALAILNRGGSRRIAMHLSIADLVVVVLLFSSNSAAATISVLADKGLPRYAWPKICYALHKFCSHIKASIVLSMFASLAYLLLVILWIMDVHMPS